jgi:hypothetical protein
MDVCRMNVCLGAKLTKQSQTQKSKGENLRRAQIQVDVHSSAIPVLVMHCWALNRRPYRYNWDCADGNGFSILDEGLDVVIQRTFATQGITSF